MAVATALAIAGGVMGLGQAFGQASAQRQQGEYQALQGEINSRFMQLQADDAVKRGEQSVAQNNKDAAKVKAEQRLNAAAQGLDPNDAGFIDAQLETEAVSRENVMTIRNNAWREAWGFRTQSADAMRQAGMARSAGENAAGNTLLTGGINALNAGVRAYGSYSSNNPPGGGGTSNQRATLVTGGSYRSTAGVG